MSPTLTATYLLHPSSLRTCCFGMESVLEPLKEFSKNSVRLVKRCTKPDRRGEASCLEDGAAACLRLAVTEDSWRC